MRGSGKHELCYSAGFFFPIRSKYSKSMTENLLKFLAKTCLIATDFQDQLISVKACIRELVDKIFKNFFNMNMKLVVLSTSLDGGKEQQHIFHVRKVYKRHQKQNELVHSNEAFMSL